MAAFKRQNGITLIEVLVALLVFSIGVLAVAMLQLSALKYSDSAMRSSQASFIAHDLMERIRANPDTDYAISSLEQAPSAGNLDIARDQDLFDFSTQLRRMLGQDTQASVTTAGSRVTIDIDWSDARAEPEGQSEQTLTISSVVSSHPSAQP